MNSLVINVRCPVCNKTHSVTVPQDGYLKWRRHEAHIQDAMPELSDSDRELLLSGICSTCWDLLFKEDDQ